VIGIVGIAIYQLVMHLPHPAFVDNDFIGGVWLGACIGIEMLGLILFGKTRASQGL
jgi:hypothetical protein